MKIKTFLDSLPINFRHEKSFLNQYKPIDFDKLTNLTDFEINKIQIISPLCTLNNLKKIRAIAIFKKEIEIPPPAAYLLLHCGVGSVKALSRLKPYELEKKIRRLERSLRIKTETNINLSILKDWIKRSQQSCKSI